MQSSVTDRQAYSLTSAHPHARTHARTHTHTHTHTHTLGLKPIRTRTHHCTHTHGNTHANTRVDHARERAPARVQLTALGRQKGAQEASLAHGRGTGKHPTPQPAPPSSPQPQTEARVRFRLSVQARLENDGTSLTHKMGVIFLRLKLLQRLSAHGNASCGVGEREHVREARGGEGEAAGQESARRRG